MIRDHCLLATTNEGKAREIRAALSKLEIGFDSLQAHSNLPSPEESGSTFAENARLKARHYYHLTGIPTLAEDSGLLVDALDGRPGVHSARFAATDPERIAKLLKLLESVPPEERSAHFVSAICWYEPARSIEVSGEVHGRIAEHPSGSHGFGYDPVFFYPPRGKTFAELTTEEKNQISHRARALAALQERLCRVSGLEN